MSWLMNSYRYASAGCSGDVISTLNLGGYWKFDDDYTDSSGNGHTLTPVNSPSFVTGKFNSAVELDGATQYLHTGDSTDFEGSGGSISVFAWVNLDDWSTVNPHVASKWVAGSSGWRLILQDGGGQFVTVTVANANTFGATTINTGTTYHVGFTYDNNNVKLYIDGSQVGSTNTIGAKTLANRNSLLLGWRASASEWFDGWMDDVSIWQRVLSDAEISTMYSAGCPLKS